MFLEIASSIPNPSSSTQESRLGINLGNSKGDGKPTSLTHTHTHTHTHTMNDSYCPSSKFIPPDDLKNVSPTLVCPTPVEVLTTKNPTQPEPSMPSNKGEINLFGYTNKIKFLSKKLSHNTKSLLNKGLSFNPKPHIKNKGEELLMGVQRFESKYIQVVTWLKRVPC